MPEDPLTTQLLELAEKMAEAMPTRVDGPYVVRSRAGLVAILRTYERRAAFMRRAAVKDAIETLYTKAWQAGFNNARMDEWAHGMSENEMRKAVEKVLDLIGPKRED